MNRNLKGMHIFVWVTLGTDVIFINGMVSLYGYYFVFLGVWQLWVVVSLTEASFPNVNFYCGNISRYGYPSLTQRKKRPDSVHMLPYSISKFIYFFQKSDPEGRLPKKLPCPVDFPHISWIALLNFHFICDVSPV